MRKFIWLLQLAIISSSALTKVYAADWQFAGYETTDNVSFFDAEGIQYPDKDKDIVHVWVKYMSAKTINSYIQNRYRKQVIEATAKKLKSGYVPNYLKLESVLRTLPPGPQKTADVLIDLISSELVANMAGVHATNAIYLELDCKGKRIGVLSYIKYRKDGSVAESQSIEQPRYNYITSDSTGEWLSMLVCPNS